MAASHPARAALTGIVLAAALGGIALLGIFVIARTRLPECVAGDNACALEQQLAKDAARWQIAAAIALELLAASVAMLLREPKEK